MTLTQRISNIWYHFKWPIIVIIIFAAIIIFAISQSFSKITPDASIMYAGVRALTATDYDDFEKDATSVLSRDYNGDGKKKIDIVQITFNMFSEEGNDIKTFYNPEEQATMKQRFDIEISIGSSVIYILEPALYNGIKELMLPLDEALGYAYEKSEDGYCIKLSSLPIYYKTAFRNIPEDNVICVRKLQDNNSSDYQNNLSAFKDIVEYK